MVVLTTNETYTLLLGILSGAMFGVVGNVLVGLYFRQRDERDLTLLENVFCLLGFILLLLLPIAFLVLLLPLLLSLF